jgi:hypothetical protein
MTKILLLTSGRDQTGPSGASNAREADRLEPTQALPARTAPHTLLPIPILWP